ncbi:M protein [Amycolatopsis stemonae]
MAPGGGEDVARTQPGFDLAWRGFHRAQVAEYVAWAEAEIHRVTAERDAARHRAATLAEDNRELRVKIDRISRTPIEPDALQERSRRMIELTREEANEITARATETAQRLRREAEREAVRLTEKERRLVAEAEAEAVRQRAEHEELLRAAEQRRRELDEAAAHRRAQQEEDHTRAMTVRRADAMRELAEQEAAGRTKANQLITDATHRAEDLVAGGERKLAAAENKAAELVRTAEAEAAKVIATGDHKLAAAETKAADLVKTAEAEAAKVIATGERKLAAAQAKAADLVKTAKAEAAQVVTEATEHGKALVGAAKQEVTALTEVRDKLHASLAGCRSLLAEAAVALDDRPAKFDPEATLPLSKRMPVQRRSPAGDLTDAVG